MGAWDSGNFDNDAAGDWVDALLSADNAVAFLDATFQAVLDEDDYLDADPCCEALAAAEVVAAWAGVPAADLDDKVRDWVAQQEALNLKDLIEKARRALARVRTDSELKDLWEEVDSLEE